MDFTHHTSLFHSPFLLYECDEFTKEFYRRNFGVTDFGPVDITEPLPAAPVVAIPSHTGIGQPEDALQSCIALVPKPPKKDYLKLFEFGNQVLRFLGKFVNPKPEDVTRRFIISFHLANDNISIYEPPQRNTGILGGKFLDARKIPLPGCNPSNPVYYSTRNLAIGNTIEVNRFKFLLEDADDYVRSFIESHQELFSPDALKTTGKLPAAPGSAKYESCLVLPFFC